MTYSIDHPPPIVYAVCCTARSGATYLCELLSSTGRLGQPCEYFNTAAMTRWQTHFDLPATATLEDYTTRLLQACTAADMFGVKTVPEALARLESLVEPTHFIWLRRRDTLRQAISLYRASHSGVWRYRSPQQQTPVVPLHCEAIEQIRGWIDSANEHWQQRFEREARPVMGIWYEEVCAQPQFVVEQIARFLERPLPEGLLAHASTQPMRDDLTEAWAERFVA